MEGMKGMNAAVEVRADDRAYLGNLKQKIAKIAKEQEARSFFLSLRSLRPSVQRSGAMQAKRKRRASRLNALSCLLGQLTQQLRGVAL